MGFTRRQSRRTARRGTDWHNAAITSGSVNLVANVQSNFNLWSPSTLDEDATVVRIVGTIYAAALVPVDVTSITYLDTLNMGIQVVNRAKNVTGSERSPGLADDREGGEWMWMGQKFHASTITDGTQTPANAWMDHQGGEGYNPYIDIRVKRKFDKSQDEILLSYLSLNRDWVVSHNLRMLIMQK